MRKEEGCSSFAKCVREPMCMGGRNLFNGDVFLNFVKSGYVREGFCPRQNDYDGR